MPQATKITGREVMQRLADVHDAQPGREQRQAARKNWPAYVTVSWDAHEDVEAVAHDVSDGGLCFFAQRVPPTGTRVVVRFNELPGQPTLEGTVRYDRHIGGEVHRVGVEFSG